MKKILAVSIELERKCPFSIRLYNILALSFTFCAIILSSASLSLFLSSSSFALLFWHWVFYFILGLFLAGFVLGVKQRLRGGYLLSRICVILLTVSFALLISLLIFVKIHFGRFYIFPFSRV